MKKKIGSLVKIALIAIVVLIAAVVGYNVLTHTGGDKETMSKSIVSGYISDIGELATAEYGYTMAHTANKPKKTIVGFEIPFTDSKVIYSYEGLIKAGFNFADIEVEVDNVGKRILITLPEAKILSSSIDRDSLIVYDERNSPFNAFTFEDMNLSIGELEDDAKEAALSNGLLERAAENAKSIITSMIGNLYESNEYTVEFE